MSDDAKQLRRVRNGLQALGNVQWFLAADECGNFVEAKTGTGEFVEVARFHQGATPEEIDFFANSPHFIGFLLGLVDRAIASAKRGQGARPARQVQAREKDFATEAAMKCNEPAFKFYLHKRHGLDKPLTDDRVAGKLRSVLDISSRKELNSDAQAAERWRSLRADFTVWRRASP